MSAAVEEILPLPPGLGDPPGQMRQRVAELRRLRDGVRRGPGGRAGEAQHAKGKLTARERIDLLFDAGSFTEVETVPPAPGDRVRAGGAAGRIPTVWSPAGGRSTGGRSSSTRTTSGSSAARWARPTRRRSTRSWTWRSRRARRSSALNDGAGARIQEGVTALAGYGGIFQRNVRGLGGDPADQRDARAVRGRGLLLARADRFRLHGPRDLADVHHRAGRGPAVTGEEISQDELGGADVHAGVSGVAAFVYDDEESCLRRSGTCSRCCRRTTARLPPPAPAEDPSDRRSEALLDLVPAETDRALRHARRDRGRSSTTASSSRCTSTGRRT